MISVTDRHVFFNTPSAKHFSSDLTYVTLLLFLGPHMVYCKANLLQHVPRIISFFPFTHSFDTFHCYYKTFLMATIIIHNGVHTNVHEESLIPHTRNWWSLGVW